MDLIPFASAAVLGAILPGADFALVARYSSTSGLREGVFAALGIACGMTATTTVAILGLGSVVADNPGVFTAIRLVGAGYLVFLGARMMLSLLQTARQNESFAPASVSGSAPFRQGFVVNVTNPKAMLFILALIPQALPENPLMTSKVILGSIMVFPVLFWLLAVSFGFSLFQDFFSRRRNRRALEGITAVVLISIGLEIAVGSGV